MSLKFDQLLKDGEIIKVAYLFAEEGYRNGDFGHTRKLLIEFLAKRVQELEDIIYQDARQAVLEGLYEENESYRKVIKVIEKYANDCIDVEVEMNPFLVLDDIKTLEETE